MATNYLVDIFRFNGLSVDVFHKTTKAILFSMIILVSILIMLILEYSAVKASKKEVILSNKMAIVIAILITFMGVFKNPSEFIYFQF